MSDDSADKRAVGAHPESFSGRAHARWTSWTQADPDPTCFRSCIVDTQHRRAVADAADVAMESAGVTLVKGDLARIARARALSRATMRNIRQNLVLAFVYNVLGIPLAAGVLYPTFGLLLSPIVAAAAMSFSS